MYVESFTSGTGYDATCSECNGTIGESQSSVIADGMTMHTLCFENTL